MYTIHLVAGHGSNHNFVSNQRLTLSCAEICLLIHGHGFVLSVCWPVHILGHSQWTDGYKTNNNVREPVLFFSQLCPKLI